jgi:hypothetical protein
MIFCDFFVEAFIFQLFNKRINQATAKNEGESN